MQVVSRSAVPELRNILVDGRNHDIGVLKHWRKQPDLRGILPRDLPVSLAWVRLEEGQVLETHIHPVHSLVVCCEGRVRSMGALEAQLTEGDIIIIPAGERHGFVGGGPNGFWGLSIQFESLALYEDLDSPLVTFVDANVNDADLDAVTLLIQKNEHHAQKFAAHSIFQLIDNGGLSDPRTYDHFVALLRIWSTTFQKLMFARAAFTDDSRFSQLARAHLKEEFGHDESLSSIEQAEIWDPILDALGSWFVNRMLSADNAEKTVLVHVVLEGAALVFYEKFAAVAQAHKPSNRHFEMHTEDQQDLRHMKMGLDALRNVSLRDHGPLIELQRRGWEVMQCMFDRMTELVGKRKELT